MTGRVQGETPAQPAELPIFPLGTVLFPGGILPLRVFEARYMDMVRDCMQQAQPFGVCLILQGSEVGAAAEHEMIGCSASIVDWDMQQLGLLQIRTVGGERFQIDERRVQKDGLVRGTVSWLEPDPEVAVPEEFAICTSLARRLVEDLVTREKDPAKRMIGEPYRYESAAWVSNRLCEFLPIPARAKHKLMALDDPAVRLSLVHQFLQQRKVI